MIITATDPGVRSVVFQAWLREHDIDPDGTYKVKVNEGVIRVYQFERNEDGHFYADDNGDPVTRTPFRRQQRSAVPECVVPSS